MSQPDRRTLLVGAAVAGVALPVLSACGSDATTTETPVAGGDPTTEEPNNAELVAVADVPVGGGVILGDKGVVVTQPEAGTVKAFSSTCTHQGCTVGLVDNGRIICPCHGSQFSIEDGSVLGGPASSPLPSVDVTVTGGEVELA